MRRRRSRKDEDQNGFGKWGGYMPAKISKLKDQYSKDAKETLKQSDIFNSIAIFVNGYTDPSSEELKFLMTLHGGVYHHYQAKTTTHIIASNLPDTKIKQLGNIPIVKPNWVTECIAAKKLLDYKKYLLYTNQNRCQPKINFAQNLTAADPKFISEYYNNSRLHLISTLGAEFKQLVCQLRENSDGKFPGREKLKPTGDYDNYSSVVMHIDMDCFFVSVGLKERPDLRGKPVAVTHARSIGQADVPHSSYSEIASCSYEARKCGIRNGMFLGPALDLCPQLQTITYDFQGYRDVSTTLYNTIASYTLNIEAVSCDEMYVDVGPLLKEIRMSVEQWATHIRAEIVAATGCPCSTGFGANRLQARLATKKAKPAGQYHLKPFDVETYMLEIKLSDLPGVGYATVSKLESLGLKTCGDVQCTTLSRLHTELGQKQAQTLFEQSRGIDNRPLNFHHERKSVSCDVNYGIRFNTEAEAITFLEGLSVEVCNRLQEINMKSRCVTLKLLVRAPNAPIEPPKYLGCGECDSYTKSTAGLFNNPVIIFKEVRVLYEKLKQPAHELRGVGIQLTRLEKIAASDTALTKFLKQEVDIKPKEQAVVKKPISNISKRGRSKAKGMVKPTNDLSKYFKPSEMKLPELKSNDIDLSVLNELPGDIRSELIKTYKLEDQVFKKTVEQFVPKIEQPCVEVELIRNKSRFHEFSWEQIKVVIKNWMESEDVPFQTDIAMLGDYFKQLADEGKIEDLQKMVNFLHRHISMLNKCEWHEAYYSIVDNFQQGMNARYGGALRVAKQFSCTLHC